MRNLRLLMLMVFGSHGLAHAQDDSALKRGHSVYQHYCATCHGTAGEGNGRAAKLYKPKPSNLTSTKTPPKTMEKIIREGGEALGLSEFMPPLGEELSEQQILDLVVYIQSIRNSGPK